MPATITADAVEKTIFEALPQFGVDESRSSRATPRSRTSTSTRSTSPSSSQIIEDEYGVTLKGDDVGKIKTVGDADRPGGEQGRDEAAKSSSPASAPSPRSASAPARCTSAGAPASSASRTAKGAATRVRARPTSSRSRRRGAPTASRSSRSSRATRRSAEAGWSATSCRTTRPASAAIIGTGIGGIGTLERGKELLIEHGPKKVSPLSVPLMMSNAAAGRGVDALRAARPVLRHRLRLRGGRARDRRRDADDPVRRRPTRSSPAAPRRRSRRSPSAAFARAGRAVAARHLAPVRRRAATAS